MPLLHHVVVGLAQVTTYNQHTLQLLFNENILRMVETLFPLDNFFLSSDNKRPRTLVSSHWEGTRSVCLCILICESSVNCIIISNVLIKAMLKKKKRKSGHLKNRL